jgi:hypothetical protein
MSAQRSDFAPCDHARKALHDSVPVVPISTTDGLPVAVPCDLTRKELHDLDVSVRPEYLFRPVFDPVRGHYVVPEGIVVCAVVQAMAWADGLPHCKFCGCLIVEHRFRSDHRKPMEVFVVGVAVPSPPGAET